MSKRILGAVMLCLLSQGIVQASGAVVQKEAPVVRVKRYIDVHPQSGSARPPLPEETEPEISSGDAKPEPRVDQRKKDSRRVLVSSPLYQGQKPSPEGGAVSSEEELQKMYLASLIREFDHASLLWLQLGDILVKALIVDRYVDLFRGEGTDIRKDIFHYVAMIDDMAMSSPELLQNPFKEVLRIVAIMEYDFRNGQDPDWLARSLLGERAYMDNKRRLGIR